MAVINIKVISDAVCPYVSGYASPWLGCPVFADRGIGPSQTQCYLGKKRLERAIDVYKKTVPGGADDRFAVSWLPFYLDPDAPKVGIPSSERMAQKFGADRSRALIARMRAVGAAEGIHFTYEGKAGSTRDAHRLVQLAKHKAKADGSTDSTDSTDLENAVIAQLFRTYFEEGGNITAHDDLAAAAERAGLDGPEVRAWLASDSGGPEVDAAVDEAYARGVSGVPHFIINDSIEVGGAQDVRTFVEEFVRARREA